MPARTPEEICALFKQFIAAGDLDSLLELYDPQAAFLDKEGVVFNGREGMKQVLAPLSAAKPSFEYVIKQVVRSGDIALMHTLWRTPLADLKDSYAIEVAKRQPDSTWRWLIGDPFTIGQQNPTHSTAA
jgi:ketosteroid isomerase-like protein